jgi:hypothetical protein
MPGGGGGKGPRLFTERRPVYEGEPCECCETEDEDMRNEERPGGEGGGPPALEDLVKVILSS